MWGDQHCVNFLTNIICIALLTIFSLHAAGENVVCTTGKAVFCEKPISQEENGIRACYEQAEKVNKPLFCSFNRYKAELNLLRKILSVVFPSCMSIEIRGIKQRGRLRKTIGIVSGMI